MKKITFFLTALFLFQALACAAKDGCSPKETFIFYYNWYGNTKADGSEVHWAHNIIGSKDYNGPTNPIPGGKNLASNFYPMLGNYSSTDSATIARHMEMISLAKADVIAVTWWGENDFGSKSLHTLFSEAARHGIKVCFHIEPYNTRCPASVRENIRYLNENYGNYPSYYRIDGMPCFFIYDSYLTKAEDWANLLRPEGKITIRGTELDSKIIGLWVGAGEEDFFIRSGMDGFYTYFAADGFTYGSTADNWNYLQNWACANGKIFIPCVGPGYVDTRVRPWNSNTTRERENGKYYDRMFGKAIDCGTDRIGITSFNEWHEGTQIEPAVPFKCKDFDYIDYSPEKPDYYLTRTAYWISKWDRK